MPGFFIGAWNLQITFTSRGYIELWRGDTRISQHRQEREAIERASIEPGDYVLKYPEVDVRVIGSLASQTGDTQAPTIPQNLSATAITKSRVDLSWSASTDNVAVSGYQIFRDGAPLDTVDSPVTSYSDTSVSPSTLYDYSVAAYDAAGNVSAASGTVSATTPANASPSWQAIPDQDLIVGDSYTLNLNTYCTDADQDTIQYSILSGTLPTGVTRTGAVISGTPTVAGESSTVTVQATDGIVNVSTTIDFATFDEDVTAPPVPTGLAGTPASDSQIDLTWTVPTDAQGGANEYVSGTQDTRVFRDGALRATVTAPTASYSDTGLAADTQYEYAVASRDVRLNQSATSSSIFVTTQATAPTTLGAFHYDPINGNDNNNGILVGETGSGTTLNGVPGTGARQTVGQFVTDVSSGSGRYTVGDTVYIHPPGFVFTTGFGIRSGSSVLDTVNKLNIEGLPGFRDSVIFDLATNLVSSFGGGGMGPIHSLNCNIRIANLTVHACDIAFSTGNQSGLGDVPAHGNIWENLRVLQVGPALAGAGGNGGLWKCQHANAADFEIRGCYAEATAHNTSNIGVAYQIHVPRFKIRYNYFHDLSGIGPLIHEKRNDQGVVTIGDILIHGNIFHATTAGRSVAHGNCARWRYTNNLFIRESGSAGNFGQMRSDPGGSDYTDGYQQDYSHNTWVGLGSRGCAGPNANVGGGGGCLVTGQAPGGLLVMRNELFDNAYPGFDTARAENDHQSDVDYLMLDPTVSAQEWSTQYNQAAWTGLSGAALARMLNSTHDAHSVYGTPVYAAATQDPEDATTYRLHSSSPGYQAASDGTDMGIDADDCGPQAIGYVF